jgi:hypothetical protein
MTSSGSAPQWSASLKAIAGGTGQTSYAVGDLLYANTTTTLAKLADVATGNALISGGVGVAPSWGKIGLTTHVSGTLPTANGGTNLTTFTANGVVYASSTSALTTGSALVFDGTNLGIGVSPATALSFPIGTNKFVGQTKVTSHQAGNVGSIGFGVEDGGGQSGIFVYNTHNGTFSSQDIRFLTAQGGVSSATERMRISNSGIVTMSAYGAGTATFSAAGVISSVSDETWKIKDGVPVDPDAMLKNLEPGYWFYNDEKKETFGSDRQLGFYAQNVNVAIGPEAAPVPEEGKPWGYYDRSVLAVTVMSLKNALDSIQKQQALITQLTARITALESA